MCLIHTDFTTETRTVKRSCLIRETSPGERSAAALIFISMQVLPRWMLLLHIKWLPRVFRQCRSITLLDFTNVDGATATGHKLRMSLTTLLSLKFHLSISGLILITCFNIEVGSLFLGDASTLRLLDFVNDPIRFGYDEGKTFISKLTANGQHYIPIVDSAIYIPNPANASDAYVSLQP